VSARTGTPIYLGDFTRERTVLLAHVPQDAVSGTHLRRIHFLVGETLEADLYDYWLLSIGLIEGSGSFRLLAPEQDLSRGLPVGIVRQTTLQDALPVPVNSLVALRVSPRGAPPPITGLSVVVEWGILSGTKTGVRS